MKRLLSFVLASLRNTHPLRTGMLAIVCVTGFSSAAVYAQAVKPIARVNYLPDGFTEKSAKANGVRINYRIGGSGPVVLLLHGYTQTSHMWTPLMAELGQSHTVIAPDLRGIGKSERSPGGYDKKTMAEDMHALMRHLGHEKPVAVVGHDIGLMVAYAYAAQFPSGVSKVILMDAFLPGVGDWKTVWLMRDLWHFHFHGETALALVNGRERIYFEHFWNDFAADSTKSIPEADRKLYTAAYARDDGMRAGFELFKNFEQDAKDFSAYSTAKLDMPFLVLTGEKASGTFLIDQANLVAKNVKGVVVKGSGHWLMEEAPRQVIPEIVSFLNAVPNIEAVRLASKDIAAVAATGAGVGTSRAEGIRTRVLLGDPTKPGLYTIQLEVPPNTRIEAHEHPDDRVATVISGTWYFGYGAEFDEKKLKELSPGSFYAEPAREPHFARTGVNAVLVHITGVGPSGTTYMDGKKP
jgi:pimeloyl-ACP methyl ester carboxylesterase/quercetin dioxygenase-like cupin family protein